MRASRVSQFFRRELTANRTFLNISELTQLPPAVKPPSPPWFSRVLSRQRSPGRPHPVSPLRRWRLLAPPRAIASVPSPRERPEWLSLRNRCKRPAHKSGVCTRLAPASPPSL